MSTLFVNNLNTASGTTITLPTGKQLVVTDTGGLKVPGTVVQHVQLSNTGRGAQTTHNSNSFTHTGSKFDVTITPKFQTSLILYNASLSVHAATGSSYGYWELRRDIGGTVTSFGDDGNYGMSKIHQGLWLQIPLFYVDSPNTTSAITYKIFSRANANGNTVYTGWNSASDSKANGCYVSVLEIAQ